LFTRVLALLKLLGHKNSNLGLDDCFKNVVYNVLALLRLLGQKNSNLGLDGGLVELVEDWQVLLQVVNVGDDVGLLQLRQARRVQRLVLRM